MKKILILFAVILFLNVNLFSAPIKKADMPNTKMLMLGDELKLQINHLTDITTVQWYKDGVMLDNETNGTYIIRTAKLSDAGNYYALVDGTCSGLYQTNSVFVNIDLPSQPGIETAVAGGNFLFQNEPNPAGNQINFKFSLLNTSNVKLVLNDIYGKEVATIFEGAASAGLNSFSFDASQNNLANGTYFYSLITNDYKETKSLILMR